MQRDRIDEAVLRDGDEVQIGKYRMVFHPSPRDGRSRRAGGDAAVVNAGVRARRRARRAPTMSIGEVLAELRPEFPDVTISKIRFLEEQGLVEPDRTPSGYRKFAHGDVERLRYVLAVQRDHYLPLRVIRDHLDAVDRGLTTRRRCPGAPRVPAPGRRGTAARTDRRAGDVRLTRAELLEAAGGRRALLDELESFGLVAARSGGRLRRRRAAGGPHGAASWRASGSSRGTCGRSGPRPTARPGSSSRSSRRCAASAGRRPAGRADEVGREVAALCVRLHAALVRDRPATRRRP